MRLVFIVPSSQWLLSAGVRIRYKRLEPFFNRNGCSVKIIPLQDLSDSDIHDADVVVMSKIFSHESIYIISLCRALGVNVGIDLFDDYFSDTTLSVFRRFHDWLELVSKTVDFAICSTDRMKYIASEFIEPRLIHKINDTKDPDISFEETRTLVTQKSNPSSDNKTLNIIWFGIGDNPYFNVGIDDLSRYSNALFQINKLTPTINFTILTNERSLTAENMTKIARLPIQSKIDIWSETKETNYLKDAHLAFMPVSHQNFSIAKSSNRCLTALTFGCQILSNGFDLYADFSDLIYCSSREYIQDHRNSALKFNQNTMPIFERICNERYDCNLEVYRFINFLESRVFNSEFNQSLKFCLVKTNPDSSDSVSYLKETLFPVIDGSTLAITAMSNFGIETYEDIPYFVFANHAEDLLLPKWRKYLRYKYFHESRSFFSDALCILSLDYVENNIPASKVDLEILVTARYTEKKSDKLLGLIQRELHQSIAHSSLQNAVKFLFGYNNLFYCDCHNKIQPFKAEL